MIYSFQLAVRFLLYAPSHGEDSTYHGLCYTSRGTLDETRNCSMDPPWWIDLMTHWTMGGCSASCLIINTIQIWQSLYGKIYHFMISECHGSIFKLIIFIKFKIQIWPNLSTEFSSSWLLNAMILSNLFETIFKFFIVWSYTQSIKTWFDLISQLNLVVHDFWYQCGIFMFCYNWHNGPFYLILKAYITCSMSSLSVTDLTKSSTLWFLTQYITFAFWPQWLFKNKTEAI